MSITMVSDTPGDASAIKLIRSIFMKGLATLSIETLEIAKTLKVEQYVIDSLWETIESSSFDKTINQLITGTAIHAERRSEELEGSIETLENKNINSLLTNAIKEKLLLITDYSLKEYFGGKRPTHWEEVIDAMKEKYN